MPSRVPIHERWRIVALCRAGMPQREVARMTGRTRTAVARIFTAFRDDNGRIHDAPHDVRPRSTTDEEDRWIVAAAVDQPFITARDIRGELGLNVSDQLVRRRLAEAGIRSYAACKKPILTPRQKDIRLRFAMEKTSWTIQDWKTVVFSDESSFSTHWHQGKQVWRPRGARYVTFEQQDNF